jgi:hypothetical protein
MMADSRQMLQVEDAWDEKIWAVVTYLTNLDSLPVAVNTELNNGSGN